MGLEIIVPRTAPCPLTAVLARLADAGHGGTLAMVDGVLQGPGAAPPADWRDARLRTPVGMVTLRRVPGAVAVVVFGNAEPDLQALQQAVAEAVRSLP